ncbi:MAG: hypothetical protein QOI47_1275 [Actinomycetota bacterium]|nr:hypothetical protein [Actinomycetota bacterium]
MSARAILREERGASLLLALAFLSFMGVFSVSILAFTGVGATTTMIVAARADQLYGADAGMEYGIANLKADTTKCNTSGTYTWPTTTQNGASITYACTWVSGGIAGGTGLGQYGTIITSASGISYTSNKSTGVVFAYGGSVHSAGAITFGSPANQTMSVDGNLTVAGACPSTNLTYPTGGVCTPSAAVPTPPSLSVYVPSATAAAPTVSGSCTTLYPGVYGTGGRAIPSFQSNQSYYLANGVYYINGGTVTLAGSVFGGQKAASETQALTTVAPCRASDPGGTGYTGTGVAFVLGGTGQLVVSNASARVELFARVPGGLDAGATPGLGTWAGTSAGVTLVSGSGAYVNTTSPAGIVTLSSPSLDFVEHGLTYVSSATTVTNVLANPEAGGASVFTGGLVTSGLSITVANNDDNKTMKVSGRSSGPRVVTLTSTAAGISGAAPTIVSATISPDGTLAVTGWRVT